MAIISVGIQHKQLISTKSPSPPSTNIGFISSTKRLAEPWVTEGRVNMRIQLPYGSKSIFQSITVSKIWRFDMKVVCIAGISSYGFPARISGHEKPPKSDKPHVVCMLILGASHDSNLTKYLVSQFPYEKMTKFEEDEKHPKRKSRESHRKNETSRMQAKHKSKLFGVPILGLSYPCSHLVLTCFHWKTSETLVQTSIAWLKKRQKSIGNFTNHAERV